MDWEFSFLYFLQELHNPVLDKIMVFITSLGNSGLLWIGLAVIMLFLRNTESVPSASVLPLFLKNC